MMESDDDLRAIWRGTSADVPSDRSACLTEVEWARLLTKEADDGERARAADHIGSCSECADEYRLLQPLRLWAAEVEQVLPPNDSARAARSTRWRGWWAWPHLPFGFRHELADRPDVRVLQAIVGPDRQLERLSLAAAGAVVLLVSLAVPLYFLVESKRQNTQLNTQLAQDKRDLSATRASLAAVQEELRRRPPVQTAEHSSGLQQRLTQLQTELAQGKEELSSTQSSLAALQEELRRRPPMQIVKELNALQQRLTQLTTPQLGVDIIALDRRDSGDGRGPADPKTVTIAPDVSLVTLILNFDPLTSRSTLEVEMLDESGRTRWAGRAQRNRSTATLTLAVPTDDYPAGRYDIRVFRVTDVGVLPGRGLPASRLGPQPTRVPLATYPLILSGSVLTTGR